MMIVIFSYFETVFNTLMTASLLINEHKGVGLEKPKSNRITHIQVSFPSEGSRLPQRISPILSNTAGTILGPNVVI